MSDDAELIRRVGKLAGWSSSSDIGGNVELSLTDSGLVVLIKELLADDWALDQYDTLRVRWIPIIGDRIVDTLERATMLAYCVMEEGK